MSKQDLLQELFQKFLNDQKMTPAEIRQLQAWVQDERHRERLDELLASLYEEEAREPMAAESDTRAAFEEVWARLQAPAAATVADEPVVMDMRPRRRWWQYAAAAVVIGMIGTGAYWLLSRNTSAPVVQQHQPPKPGIQPGGNKAVLTLADGSFIVLDSAQNGTLAQQGGIQVMKAKDGELEYRRSEVGGQQSEVSFNTLSTPRGGRYRLILPDGSKVWLNAASSITYPTLFTGNERRVAIAGEAYFEVAPSGSPGEGGKGIPFIVDILPATGKGGQVEVLGTHFNIHAYEEETVIKTTLLEGKVKVTTGSQTSSLSPPTAAYLKPGQQAQLVNHKLSIINADMEAAIAWKNDLIQFEGQDIHAAMRMIARWYDVEVEYRGNIPNVHFRGSMPSNVPVTEVLDMMGKTAEVHFTISGRKIIVTP